MRLFNRLSGLALATSVSLASGFAQVDAATAATTAQQVRALAQQGLQPLLQTNAFMVSAMAITQQSSVCDSMGDAMSVRLQSVSGSLSTGLRQTYTIYRDGNCKAKGYVISSTARKTVSGSTVTAKVDLTAKTYGAKGVNGGAMTISGSLVANTAKRTIVQTGTGLFSSSAVKESLALSCNWTAYFASDGSDPVSCKMAAVQRLAGIGKYLGTVSSMQISDDTDGTVLSGSFKSAQSSGSVGIKLTSPVPGVSLTGSLSDVSQSKLSVSDTGWKVVDSANGLTFVATVSSSGAFTATIKRSASGAKLATVAVDKFGDGTISYLVNSTSAKITNWTLAN
jgi:hypothetical protein